MKLKPHIPGFAFGFLAAIALASVFDAVESDEKFEDRIVLKQTSFSVVDARTGDPISASMGFGWRQPSLAKPSWDLPSIMYVSESEPEVYHAIWIDYEEDPREVRVSAEGFEEKRVSDGIVSSSAFSAFGPRLPVRVELERVQQAAAVNVR